MSPNSFLNSHTFLGAIYLLTTLSTQFQPIGSRALKRESSALEREDGFTTTLDSVGRGEEDIDGLDNQTLLTGQDTDPCALVLPSAEIIQHQSLIPLIRISHSVFDVSRGIVPGVTYQVSVEVPVDHEFLLEFWLSLSGTDEVWTHSYPNSNNKKRRHRRDRRENQWIELSPVGVPTDAPNQTAHQPFPCSRNAFGGIHNESSSSSPQGTQVYTFNWFLKSTSFPSTSANVVFRLRFRGITFVDSSVFEESITTRVESGCNLTVKVSDGESTKLTLSSLWNSQAENIGLNCTVLLLPTPGFGLQAKFSNLSVYGIRDLCKGRFLLFNSNNNPQVHSSSSLPFQSSESDEQELTLPFNYYKYCGKIEDYSSEEKWLTFPATTAAVISSSARNVSKGILLKVELPGYIRSKETFSIEFHSISPCDKVLLSNLSGTLEYEASGKLKGATLCSIVIHVPYGNTINAELRVVTPELEDVTGDENKTDVSSNGSGFLEKESESNLESKEIECILNSRKPTVVETEGRDGDQYFIFRVQEVGLSETDVHDRVFCLRRRRTITSGVTLERRWKSVGNRMRITFSLNPNFPQFELRYQGESVPELRRECEEGWVHVEDAGCVILKETRRSWTGAEATCQDSGGHLVTIKNDLVQQKLEQIISNSASFHPDSAYWIGANDREYEGNFQWTSGLPFIFTDWFPGWPSTNSGHVNAQPNDDGLSGQDCVELRQEFAPKSSSAILPSSFRNGDVKELLPKIFPGYSSTQPSSNEPVGKSKRKPWVHTRSKSTFYWNDRNCQTLNFFLCERGTHQGIEFVCNRTLRLGQGPTQVSSLTVTSPAYPSSYPDNTLCITRVETLPGYRIIANFDEFHLEDSPYCKYDSLELIEGDAKSSTQVLQGDKSTRNKKGIGKRLCGNWNRRLKLLAFTSTSSTLNFKFESDFSHTFPGFKATVSTQKVIPHRSYDEEVTEQCLEQRMKTFGGNCYLVVSSPVTTWETALQTCQSLQGSLTSIITVDEWRFVTQTLVSSPEYQKKFIYWIGGYLDQSNQLVWKDRMPFNFSAFHPSDLQSISEWKCLSLYWHEGGKGTFAWRLSSCNQLSGYICKKPTKVEFIPDFNRTFVGIGGKLTSPNFPSHYQNNLDYTTQLSSPLGTLIVLQFVHLDIETQDECLYDHIQIIDRQTRNISRVCGTHSGKDLERFDFVSTSNSVEVVFHSDFSESMSGFELIWRAIDVTECISGKTILTGLGNGFPLHQGSMHSPNFPYFNLPSLNCVYTIVAPAGQRIWIHFDIFEVGDEESREEVEEVRNSLAEAGSGNGNCADEDHVEVDLWSDTDFPGFPNSPREQSRKSIILCGNLTTSPHRTSFASYGERIQIRIVTRAGRRGRGFLGKFKAVPGIIKEKMVVQGDPNSSFLLTSINYPFLPPPEVNLTLELTSPPNYIITLKIRGVAASNCQITANTYIIIHDPYVGSNGASWTICQPDVFPFEGELSESHVNSESAEISNNVFVRPGVSDMLVSSRNVLLQAASPISFQSTFNRLELTQVYLVQGPRRKWNAEVVVSLDENFRAKVLSGGDRLLLLNACTPNPCLNGGKCVTDGDRHICRCPLPFTGPFCGLSVCDLSPCLFGDCVVELTSYKCHCHMGYAGENCDRRSKPCMKDGKDEKCMGHGECIEINDSTYKCRCHAFWDGPRCEGRMQNIRVVPLSERMLKEPFWLGIITVTVVLGVIGLVWCLKRHFPEKLEKFLNEDLDRNRRISWVSARSPSSIRLGGGCSYHGVRDPIASTSQQATSPLAARSFLGRFGIRKPSLLSLSSAASVSAATTSPHTYENRTFSLDDLLRPSRSSMMRTPSPRSRRNFSIHSRRDPVEKQQILQQLVSSGASVSFDGTESKPATPKPTIAEIIQMSEKRLRLANLASASQQNEPSPSFSIFMDKAVVENETSFSNPHPSTYASTTMSAASKAEKKVTFARLLDKLTAHDMSSSSSCSDLSCAEEATRTIMVNPRPPKKDRKGRLKRSKAFAKGRNSETDQDGFEMSSSDTTPDPICPPRFPSRACVSPTGLSVSANNSPSSKVPGKSLPKMASADSLLALFRRFSGSNSAPPSPQYSENEESSAVATPLSTPSSPRNSALSLNIRPPAFLITTPETSADASTSPGHEPFSTSGGAPGSWRAQAQNMSVISLEVPMREHCLSPIHEVPTPLPTPSHSPAHTPMMMHRPKQSTEPNAHSQGLPMIKLHASSEAEEEEGEIDVSRNMTFPVVIPKIAISVEGEDGVLILTDSDPQSTPPSVEAARQRKSRAREIEPIPDVLIHAQSDPSSQSARYEPRRFTFDDDDMARVERRLGYTSDSASPGRSKTRPPPLAIANEIMSDSSIPCLKEETDLDEGKKEDSMTIPLVNVENPTPIGTPTVPSPMPVEEREYPLIGKNVPVPPDITAFAVVVSPRPWEIHSMHQHAHAPLLPPIIMLNPTSEAESDSDTAIRKLLRKPNLGFLSPFAGASDRVPSESNLSTSGYSSMASPCHSRCPSVSPLCPDNMEEYHGGAAHHYPRRSSLITPSSSRKSSLTMTPRRCSLNATSPLVSFASNLIGMGGVSSFGESTELIEVEMETDSALEVETDPEVVKLQENRDLSEEFISLANLLQVPRKNLPKSHSLDMDVGNQGSQPSKPIPIGGGDPIEKRGRNQPIRKGESLDSKLNSVSSNLEQPFTPLPTFQSALTKNRGGSQGLGDEQNTEIKRLSPVSSRSDSSMSELSICGIVGGFTSPMTDSDGVYDCASSEVQSGVTSRDLRKSYANSSYLSPSQQIRRSGRRRNRRRMSSAGGAKKSPTFFPGGATVVPFVAEASKCQEEEPRSTKDHEDVEVQATSRPLLGSLSTGTKKTPWSSSSPKRRVRAQTNLDVTSSSTESLNSLRSSRSRMSSPPLLSPKQEIMEINPGNKVESLATAPDDPLQTSESRKHQSTKLEENFDLKKNTTGDLQRKSPSPGFSEGKTKTRDSSQVPRPPAHKNISRSRLKVISLQIRFLRRLERNLVRKKEHLDKTRERSQEEQEASSWSSTSTCSTCTSTTTSSTGSTSEEDASQEGGQSSFEDQNKERPDGSPPPDTASLQSLSLPLSSRVKRRRK